MSLKNIENYITEIEYTLNALKNDLIRLNLEPNSQYKKKQLLLHCYTIKRKIYKITQNI